MSLFQCPKCGTPISGSECSCGTIIPSYVVRQIQAMQEVPRTQLALELPPDKYELPLRLDPG